MHLKFDLSQKQLEALTLAQGDQVRYASACDLNEKGEFYDGFVAVTQERIVVFDGDELKTTLLLDDCQRLKCEVYVGCGALVARVDGAERVVARFSLKHADRFSEIAGRVNAALLKQAVSVKKGLRERYCIVCGEALNGTVCAACSNRKVSFDRFWGLCKPYIWRLILISALMLVSSSCTLYAQQVQKVILGDYLKDVNGVFADVLPLFLFIGVLGAVNVFSSVAKRMLCVHLGAKMSMDLRQKVFNKVQTLSMSFMSRAKAGELMNRVTTDTGVIREFMDHCFGGMLSNLVTMVGALILMLFINWKLALVAVSFTPLVLVLSRLFNKKIRTLFRAQSRKHDKIKNRLQDVISGIRVVKTFGREKVEAKKFEGYSEELAVINSNNEVFWAIFFPMLTLLVGLGVSFVTYFGGVEVLGGRMPIETLVQFTAYAMMLYAPLRWMANLPRMIMRMLNSLDRIYAVLDEEPEVVDTDNAVDHEIGGDVEFRNVSFGYNSYETVLQNVSFKVKKGEMIGIVGPSGVGKSSLINLLMRLYDVDDGQILLDGVDLRSIRKEDLHRQIGVVLQETFLFSGTVLDNIRYSCPNASMEEIIVAAKMANAHDFICAMPDGYNTYIGEKGYKVSGGERQRIAISRAILSNPRLLILDEATSSLDTESEDLVQQAIERMIAGRTTFAIAHRLSTLRNANRIIVLNDHTVDQIGTHEELMRQKGIYYGLVTAQSKLNRVKSVQDK